MDDIDTAGTLASGLLAMQTLAAHRPAGSFPLRRRLESGRRESGLSDRQQCRRRLRVAQLRAVRAERRRSATSPRAAQRSVDWLLGQQLTGGPISGLLTGGWGTIVRSCAEPERTAALGVHRTQSGCLASVFRSPQRCSTAPSCAAAADTLRQAILDVLWDPAKDGFSQGMRPEGRDTVEPLDVNSWGCDLPQCGGPNGPGRRFAESRHRGSRSRTEARRASSRSRRNPRCRTGRARSGSRVRSGWPLRRLGTVTLAGYAATMAGLVSSQRADGSMPMASTPDPDRELTTASAMAATTWFILAANPGHPASLWAPHLGGTGS